MQFICIKLLKLGLRKPSTYSCLHQHSGFRLRLSAGQGRRLCPRPALQRCPAWLEARGKGHLAARARGAFQAPRAGGGQPRTLGKPLAAVQRLASAAGSSPRGGREELTRGVVMPAFLPFVPGSEVAGVALP